MIKLVAAIGAVFVALAVLVGPVGADDVPRPATRVAVAGPAVAGSAMRVEPAAWASTPDTRAYEWLRDGEGDVLSRDATYTTTGADVGHTLVVVERVWFGSKQDETSSRPVAVSSDSTTLVAPTSVVTGSPAVGRTLRVDVSGGTPGATTTLQWLRDGADIAGAVGSAYTPTTADAGRTLTVRTTAVLQGSPVAVSVSSAANVRALTTRRPTVKGTAKVGKRLRIRSKGAWHAPGHTYRYQWLRNGTKISGATSSSYRLRAKDRDKRLSVRVYARKPGFVTVTATSARTTKIR